MAALAYSDHELLELNIPRGVRKASSTVFTFWSSLKQSLVYSGNWQMASFWKQHGYAKGKSCLINVINIYE